LQRGRKRSEKEMDKISIIISVRNEANKIGQCLEALFSQSLKPYEVIVVDGHSTDMTVENAKKYPVKIFYEDYYTRAGGCHIGLENAKGDFIAFTDADCIPERNWLENLIKEFNNSIVGVGGAIKNIGDTLWEKSINLAFATFLGSANSIQGRLFKTKRFVRSISGCSSIYRRQDLLKVGGFNPLVSGAEDTEINGRLLKIGKLLWTPNAVVLHDHRRGLKEFAKHMYRYGGWRRECRLWDLQAIPPLIVPLVFLSLIFTRWLVLSAFLLYLVAIIAMGIKFTIQERNIKYIISIPVVYIVEHSFYIIGFWKETIRPKKERTPWR
jgi:glycosyltransferase involved in cell wall biosynthesis